MIRPMTGGDDNLPRGGLVAEALNKAFTQPRGQAIPADMLRLLVDIDRSQRAGPAR